MSIVKAIRMLLALHCDESTLLISSGQDRTLAPVERWAVRLHLISCRSCRRFRKQVQYLQDAARRLRQLAVGKKLPLNVRQQIERSIRQLGSG